MSNEELVLAIKNGEDRMEELWNQVERLVRWKAKHIMTVLSNGGNTRGVEFDDLFNSGYLALVKAVETYDPEAGGAFSTWFVYYLRSAFAVAAGYRTKKGQKEPLNNALSMDKPLTDDADSSSFGDLIPDQRATDAMDAVEEKVWREHLRKAVDAVMSEIPEKNREVLRMRFWDNLTLDEVGQRKGISREAVRNIEQQGIRQMRQPRNACHLKPFYDFNFYCHAGLSAFRRKGMSVQEQYLVIMEEREERKAKLRQEELERKMASLLLLRKRDTVHQQNDQSDGQ